MIITYQVKTEYGNARRYPTDESVAVALRSLTGRRTLTDSDVEALRALGVACVEESNATQREEPTND